MTNWKTIDPIFKKFTSQIQQEWEDWGFNQEEVKEWLIIGLTLKEAGLADFLRHLGYIPDFPFTENDLEKWRESYFNMVVELINSNQTVVEKNKIPNDELVINQEEIKKSWTDIDPSFAEKPYLFSKTRQQLWEEKGFTYQEVKEWLAAGFKLGNSWYAKQWKDQGFTVPETKKWVKIGFKPRNFYQAKKWKEKGFSSEQTKILIDQGLNISDYDLASWLVKEEKYSLQKIFREDIEKLKNSYSSLWKEINPIFAEINYSTRKTYQREWEEAGFTVEETREWVSAGFIPFEYIGSKANETKKWKENGFTPQQAKEWIRVKLRPEDYDFVFHLQKNNFTPEQFASKFKEQKNAQELIDYFYPQETRKTIKDLRIHFNLYEELEGSLDLNDFINLETLFCPFNQLTSLDVSNCEKLIEIHCSENQLTKLLLPKKGEKLSYLNLGHNQLTDLTVFSKYENLEFLFLNGNPFSGDLEPLSKLKKLKQLDIKNNGRLSPTWEYLSRNIESLSHLSPNGDNDRNDYYQELIPYREQRKISSYHFSYNLQLWRINQLGYKWLQQTLAKINPNLDIQEIINQFDFFNVKTGSFQGDLNNLTFLFEKSLEDKIFLLKYIENLTNSIKFYKEKIVNAYCSFAPEKETLQELIKIQLDLVKSKKQKLDTVKYYRKQFNKLYEKLEDNLSETEMKKIESILEDCEELTRNELELANKFNLRIEYDKDNINYYFVNVKEGHALIGNQIGNNTNLSYNNRLIKLPSKKQKLLAYIEQSPKLN